MLFGAVVGEIFFDFVLAALLLVMDWRILTLLCGAAIAVAAWPLARLVRNQPEDWGEQPDGFAPAPGAGVPDYSWREAVRSRQFWTLMAARVLRGRCVHDRPCLRLAVHLSEQRHVRGHRQVGIHMKRWRLRWASC